MERFLEKLAVFCVYDVSLCTATLLVYLVYLQIQLSFYWLICAYFVWYIYDINTPITGSRRIESLRYLKLGKYFRNYFPIKLHCKNPHLFTGNENYIFCSHPHGILCAGAAVAFSTEALNWSQYFPGLKPHVVSAYRLFRIPFYRELFLSMGHISSSKESFDYMLSQPKKGYALGLIVGGAEEMALNDPNRYVLYLNDRKGFIKIALTYGANLVPVFCFGENKLYKRIKWLENLLEKYVFNRYPAFRRISYMLNYGCGLLLPIGILPFRNAIDVVVGDPIIVEKVESPTKEHIDQLHDLYKNRLEQLFESEKWTFSPHNASSLHLNFC